MIDEKTLQGIVERIVAVARPSRVILFGSYGRGDASPESDLDILVITPQLANPYDEVVRLRKAVGNVGIDVDVLAYSEGEYERRSQVPGTVLYWARKEGRAVYEAAHWRV
jgi:predicted nucleotidyltransferase